MKVKFVGFGGYMEVPCYEDENGKLYFDENNGRNGLSLYTGAYREEWGEICGEPNTRVTENVECDEPFLRHPRERDYMMLSRLKSDCEYFLGYGYGYEGHLYYKEVNEHCDEMKKLYESFSDENKPEWINLEKIEEYRRNMLKKKKSEGEKGISVIVKIWGKEYILQFVKREYLTGNLAIEVVVKNKNVWETWCFLTVNLPGFMLNENEVFLDTNNCSKEIIDWIFKNNYAKIIGARKSGFCTYPLVELSETFMEMILISEENLNEKTKGKNNENN